MSAAAERRNHVARFAAAVWSLVFASAYADAAELLESVQLVDGGAVLSCDYTRADQNFEFTCRDTHAVFALRCASVTSSAVSPSIPVRKDFICPVSAERSAFGNALRLSCSENDPRALELIGNPKPDPRLLLEGRVPTHTCHSSKIDVD